MNYQESLDYLYGLQKFGIKLGLENIRTFLSRLDHPERRYRSILVAGTNGKGSIASSLAEMLHRAGYRTGLYTSPHLHSFSERVRVDGTLIPAARVAGLVAEMQSNATGLPLTFFEFTTALALRYFAEQQVDVAVLEVGLGGRLDATNAVEPVLSVIAPIAADHQQHLGESLEEIAREKAGIMRSGVKVVSAAQEPAVMQTLAAEAKRVGAEIIFCGADFGIVPAGEGFEYRGLNEKLNGLRPAIPGRHQFGNMATALAAAESLRATGFKLDAAALRDGVENFSWPGRLEWAADRRVLLDGAHNGAGAQVLAAYLAEQGLDNVHWIVGLKADKNREEILAPILPHAAAVYCVEPPVEAAVPAALLEQTAVRAGVAAQVYPSLAEALRQARAAAGSAGVVLVAGSLFLVAAVREMILTEEGCPCGTSVCI